jgi:uncharacterized membrane protein YfcA
MHFEFWQWVLIVLGAFLVGVSKTGIAGFGILFVAIFANVIPARQATGFVLSRLICGDVFAVASYRQHTVWRLLWRLFPWTALGVVLGTFALGRLDDATVRRLVGGIIVALSALHVWRKWSAQRGREDEELVAPAPPWFAVAAGGLAGFTTQVAKSGSEFLAFA